MRWSNPNQHADIASWQPVAYRFGHDSPVLAGVVIALGILGVMWMNSVDVGMVRNGAVLVIVAAIVAFPTMWGSG